MSLSSWILDFKMTIKKDSSTVYMFNKENQSKN